MGFVKNKEWYKSKALWGAGFAFLLAVITTITGETSVYASVLITIGTALGIYGRAVADSKIKF